MNANTENPTDAQIAANKTGRALANDLRALDSVEWVNVNESTAFGYSVTVEARPTREGSDEEIAATFEDHGVDVEFLGGLWCYVGTVTEFDDA